MNIINAIINIVENPVVNLREVYSGKNRANSMGGALEEYIKDMFSSTFNITNESERLKKWSETFSYLGNQNNPPDSMLKNGDSIEVKKIESPNSSLALNSSYPKDKLYSDSPMITATCRKCESWSVKDIIYAVGHINNNRLNSLCMVYGMDYAASSDVYEKIKNVIKEGVTSIENVEFSKTKELGRVNKVDPLGITYLRIRGMWVIENPWRTFNYIYNRDFNNHFNFMAIINIEKWNSFDNKDTLIKLSTVDKRLEIVDVDIKDPNNPAVLKQVKLITFFVEEKL